MACGLKGGLINMSFFKVFFHQSYEVDIEIKSLLCEDFADLPSAINAGIQNMYDNSSYFFVKEYDETSDITIVGGVGKINDSGKLIYFKGGAGMSIDIENLIEDFKQYSYSYEHAMCDCEDTIQEGEYYQDRWEYYSKLSDWLTGMKEKHHLVDGQNCLPFLQGIWDYDR